MGDCSMTRSVTTRRGAVFLPHQRDQEAARSNRRESPRRVQFQRRLSGARKRLMTKLPYTMASWSPTWSRWSFMEVCSMLLAAVSAPRV
jgi:hypothetical protein